MKQAKSVLFLCLLGMLLTVSLGFTQIRGPLVVSDRWPECTDLSTWSRDIFRLDGVTDSSERDRAISLFNWLRLYNRLCEGVGGMAHAFEGAWGEEQSVRDLHKNLFVYGWGFCDTHSIIAEGLWQEYMKDSLAADRVICMHENGGYHTMYRLRMDGRFGAFDARYGYYLLEKDSPDARILDWDGVGEDRNIRDNMKYVNRCRPFFECSAPCGSSRRKYSRASRPGAPQAPSPRWFSATASTGWARNTTTCGSACPEELLSNAGGITA